MAIWIKPSGLEIETNDRDATLEAAVCLGWKLKPETTSEPDLTNDGEKGSGEPGTFEWHESAIKGCSNSDEVEEYMRSIEIEMNASGHLRTVKKNAIQLMKEKLNDNSV